MITIELNQRELTRWFNALMKVENTAKLQIEDRIQLRMAIDYEQLLRKNLLSGKYSGTYKGGGYNERYGKWKQKYYGGIGYWRLKGDLLASLTTWKDSEGGYRAGVLSGTYDSGGKSWGGGGPGNNLGQFKEVGMYGWIMEFGKKAGPGGRHRKRPLFKPTMDEYADAGHQDRGEEALDIIGAQWS